MLARLLQRRPRKLKQVPQTRAPARVFVVIRTVKAQACFEITAEGALEFDSNALPQEGAILYVFEAGDKDRESADRRFALPKKMSARAAHEHVLEAISEKARIIRSANNPQIAYARDLRSLGTFNRNLVIPGALVVDHFVSPTSAEPVIVPVVLQNSAGDVLAVLIYTVRPGADEGLSSVERLQYTKAPQITIESLVVQYSESAARALKIESLATARAVGPTEKELFELATQLPSYATENDLLGVPVSQALKVACVVSAVFAAVSVGANILMGAEAGYLAVSADKAQAERDELRKKINHTLTTQIRSFASAMSIDEGGAIQAAKDVWHPNSFVSIDCTSNSCLLGLSASVTRRGGQAAIGGSDQLASQVVEQEMVSDVLTQAAPPGFKKKEVAITGDGNVVTVTFEQQKSDSPVRRLLPH